MEEESVTREVVLRSKWGLHARPAARLAQEAQKFKSEIRLGIDGREVDAKSILDVLTLAASGGAKLQIVAAGADAKKAVTHLSGLLESRLEEDR
ncbi:MAG: HPr family phosphocarrier protein [Desulfonatronovibrionaceae bacterium]